MRWSLGDIIYQVRAGYNRWFDGRQTIIELPSIITCGGGRIFTSKNQPALTNNSLFERDNHQCLYCGKYFGKKLLTRDHIVPKSK